MEQILRHEEILDITSFKFCDFDPNLHFVGMKFCKEKN